MTKTTKRKTTETTKPITTLVKDITANGPGQDWMENPFAIDADGAFSDYKDIPCLAINFAIRLDQQDPKNEAIATVFDAVYGDDWEQNEVQLRQHLGL